MSEQRRSRRRTHPSSRWSRRLKQTRFYRTLRKDRLFAFALVCVILISSGVAFSVLRLWQTTPPNFRYNTIKVSTIDLLQTWSLSRTARRAEQAGDHEGALSAWTAAAAHNGGDPRPHRGILTSLGTIPVLHADHRASLLATVRWLTALTGTNVQDAILIGEVLERHGAPEAALPILRNVQDRNNQALNRTLARCLVTSGSTGFPEFLTLWSSHQNDWSADAQGMALCHDAWTIATAEPPAASPALQRLQTATTQKGEPGLAAARLLQMAAYHSRNPDAMGLAIRRLEEGHARPVARHGRYWQLLHQTGRHELARNLARAFKDPILDPPTATEYLDALRLLGLPLQAQSFAETNLEHFGLSPGVWRAYFDVLIEARLWDELRRVASAAKVLASSKEALYAHAIYADFIAAQATQRNRDTTAIAAELAALKLDSIELLLRIAAGLRTHQHPDDALSLLRNHEPNFSSIEEYWNELFLTGYALKNLDTVRRAASELATLNPASPTARNNRTALVLLSAEPSAEALELTLAGLSENPKSPLQKINRALALLYNARPQEVPTLLEGIDPSRLSPDSASNYFYALALSHAALQQPEAALAAARKIRRESLFPQQIARLTTAVPGLP